MFFWFLYYFFGPFIVFPLLKLLNRITIKNPERVPAEGERR